MARQEQPTPAEDIARRILGEDVTQIDYYTERVKRMVGRVLNGNGITELIQGRYRLIGSEELSDSDAYPVSEGHSLVIPRRHVADGMQLHQPEWNAVVELLRQRREMHSTQDATITGWAGSWVKDLGLNSGEAAGQTVFHAHWHLIPRREGDCEEPRGGVRGVIRGKQGH